MAAGRNYRSHPDGNPFDGVIANTREGSEPSWPVAPVASDDAPNVVFIVLDDLGYAQLGCYGGLGDRIRTPHMDALATGGLRYRNFHTTALCSPTRAALLTGRNHHSVGLGVITERATGFPGYHARIPKESAMVPKVLGDQGWATYCLGKWHLTPDEHNGPTGPFDRWPLGQGFDRYYGFLPGETDQWSPDLWEDNHRIDPPDEPGYHVTTDLADHAIQWLTEHDTINDNRPFFLHFAPGAPHAPHHAPAELIASYHGVFDDGWDVIRDETFARQLELGVVPEGTTLPPRNPGVRPWDELSDIEQRVYLRQMEVYAAFVTHTDTEIGRLLDHLRDTAQFDNTLIFLLSDNGASAEGGRHGLISEITYFNGETEPVEEMVDHLDAWGGPTTYPHYANGWAWLGNTPQRWYKSMVHEGGTRDPLIISWPARMSGPNAGQVRDQFHHVVDLAATVYELLEIDPPTAVNGVDQRELEGESLAYTLSGAGADDATRKDRQYFEMFAHRAIWADGWKAVAMRRSQNAALRIADDSFEVAMGDFDGDTWELYHLAEDFSEAHDLATAMPDKLAELQQLWWDDAARYNVLPLDDRVIARSMEPRPRVVKKRDSYTFRSPVRLTRSTSPNVNNRDHHITATIEVPATGCEGVIASNGGMQGGYSLFVLDGHLHYVSNWLGREHFVVRANEPVPDGRVELAMDWRKTDQFAGTVTLWQNGDAVGEGEVTRTNPVIYAVAEGLEIGTDTGTPVWPRYRAPFRFTGQLVEVTLHTRGPLHVDDEAEDRIARYVQ
jgi:arylsulfatase